MRPDRAAIIHAYEGGSSIREVAAELHTTKHQVYVALLEAGVDRRAPGGHCRELPEDLGQVPDRVIADREGITVQAVQYLRYSRARREAEAAEEYHGANEDPSGPELPDRMYE